MSSVVCGLLYTSGMHKCNTEVCVGPHAVWTNFEIEWFDTLVSTCTLVTSLHICFSCHVCYDPICFGLFAE